jgi:hypothetical protein
MIRVTRAEFRRSTIAMAAVLGFVLCSTGLGMAAPPNHPPPSQARSRLSTPAVVGGPARGGQPVLSNRSANFPVIPGGSTPQNLSVPGNRAGPPSAAGKPLPPSLSATNTAVQKSLPAKGAAMKSHSKPSSHVTH